MKKNIFITGSTGFLGWYIVKELLKESHNIYLLIRTKERQLPHQRINALLDKDFEKSHIKEIKNRIRIVEGDIVQSGLGIEGSQRKELVRKIDTLYHCAALCEFGIPLEKIRKINAEGTKNVLEFAKACREKGRFRGFIHISTAAVAGDYSGIYYEDSLDEGQGFNNTYEQTKFEAEELVQSYRKEGMPIAVFRPGVITGDSITGEVSNFQMFYQFLHILSLELFKELPINRDNEYGLVPVDYVAKAICLISSNTYNNKTYHLLNSNNIPFDFFLEFAGSYFGFNKPRLVPDEDYNYANLSGFRKKLIHFYLPYLIHKKLVFDTNNFEAAINGQGFTWPKVDEGLLRRLFKYCDKIGYIKRRP